jgi:predicted methyltransferase
MEESTFLNPARTLEYAGLEEGMKVADLGAGSGFFTRAAARRVGEGGILGAVVLFLGAALLVLAASGD